MLFFGLQYFMFNTWIFNTYFLVLSKEPYLTSAPETPSENPRVRNSSNINGQVGIPPFALKKEWPLLMIVI